MMNDVFASAERPKHL